MDPEGRVTYADPDAPGLVRVELGGERRVLEPALQPRGSDGRLELAAVFQQPVAKSGNLREVEILRRGHEVV